MAPLGALSHRFNFKFMGSFNGCGEGSGNEELHNLYRSPNVVRVIKSRILRRAGHVARMVEGKSAFKILTAKHTGKRLLGRRRREDNIRIDLIETDINARNWVDRAHDNDYWRSLVNAALSHRVP